MSAIHCLLVLYSSPPPASAVKAALEPLGRLGELPGAGFVLEVDDRAVHVDVGGPWPSEASGFVGDPYGPLARPESLQRAIDHPWTWKESRMIAPKHQASVRLQLLRSGPAVPELLTLTRVAAALLDVKAALCAFTPAGEALRSKELVQGGLKRIGPMPAPVDLWTNTRLASLGPVWQAMDTVGMGQLDHPDLEAIFSTEACSWRAADAFLRNLQLYLLDGGQLEDGDHLPGPDTTEWEVRPSDRSLMAPHRPVLQLAPAGGVDLPVVTT